MPEELSLLSYSILVLPELLMLGGLAAVGLVGLGGFGFGKRGGKGERGGTNEGEGRGIPPGLGPAFGIGGILLFTAILALLPLQHRVVDAAGTFGILRFLPFASATATGGGLLILDTPGIFFSGVIAVAMVAAVLAAVLGHDIRTNAALQFFAGLFGVAFAGFLLAGANDLLVLWCGIEVLVLASRTAASAAAAPGRAPYRIGPLFSALSLFGVLLFYGLFGTTELFGIAGVLSARNVETVPVNGLLIAALFLLLGSLARIGLGVAELLWGKRSFSLLFLSLFVAMSLAGYAVVSRLSVGLFPPDLNGIEIGTLLVVLGSLTALCCALLAAGADDVYRGLCCAAGAHIGTAILPLASRSTFGFTAGTAYLAVHLALTLAVAFGMQHMPGAGQPTVAGLSARRSLRGTMSAVTLFTGFLLLALAGIPFTAGFLSRFFLFNSLLQSEQAGLFALGSGAAVSILLLYTYGRGLFALYFHTSGKETRETLRQGPDGGSQPVELRERLAGIFLGLCVLPAILLGFPGGFRLFWNLMRSWLMWA